MTSPGVKRPLDYDTANQTSDMDTSSSGTTTRGGATGDESDRSSIIKLDSTNDTSNISPSYGCNIGSTNGTKRRCISNDNFHSPKTNNQPDEESSPTNLITGLSVNITKSAAENSPFKNSLSSPISLSDSVSALIKEELQNAATHDTQLDSVDDSIQPILTARQAQSICERIAGDVEQKLREEYDKILARKLADQYDVFAKANYLNSFVESARRLPANSSLPTATVPTTSAPRNQAISQIAAALRMQSTVAAAAAVANTQTVASTTNPMTELNQLAATITAANGGHSSAINASHQLSYNSFQQQAAAAAAAAAALQHQAAVHQHSHHQQPTGASQPSQHIANVQHRMASSPLSQITAGSIAGSVIPFGPVLLTSNLDEQLAVPEALFTLFGVFGDVIRVKILFNKKDNALIQMADATQAQVAQGYLDKQRIFGKAIRVTKSKHQLVQMPREGNQSDAGLTKDFTNSPLHRFKIPGSRNYLNIYPPSNTLHISNIPAKVDEDDLHKAFKEECSFDFVSFKFFPKDRKMALMKFASTEHATIALIKMHNFQISEEHNLRVSFSKTLI